MPELSDDQINIRRKHHIMRFYGKDNSSDDDTTGLDNSDVWLDIAVLDEFVMEFGSGPQYLKITYKFTYPEFDEQFDEEGNNVRVTETKRISNPSNPAQVIEIHISKTVILEFGSGDQYQRTKVKFDNSKNNETRQVYPRKIIHYTINDDFLHEGFDRVTGDSIMLPPRDPREYLNAIKGSGSKSSKAQYVMTEVVKRWISTKASGPQWKGLRFILNHASDPLMQDVLVDAVDTGDGVNG